MTAAFTMPAKASVDPTAPADKAAARPGALILPNLPEEFWGRREFLAKVRDAAYSLGCSADAALGAALSRVSAMAHPELRFDFGLGDGALNIFTSLVSESGIGKSSSKKVATRLILPPPYLAEKPDDFHDGVPMGSGEGIAELFMGETEVETGEFHKRATTKANKGDPVMRTVRGKVRSHAWVYVDEGETISKLMDERQGSTLGPQLRTAWMGEGIGQSNGRAESTRRIPEGSYSLGLLVGYQPAVAQALLADGGPGTPQRFLWLSAYDPNVPLRKRAAPAPFVAPLVDRKGEALRGIIRAYPEVEEELWLNHVRKVRREMAVETLDSHAPLTKGKLSSMFAALDGGRLRINAEDWSIAEAIWAVSGGVRDALVSFGKAEVQREQEARTAAYVEREARTHAAKIGVAGHIERCAAGIARRIHEKGPATRGAAKGAMAGRDKPYFEQALDRAVTLRWVELKNDDREIVAGQARPT